MFRRLVCQDTIRPRAPCPHLPDLKQEHEVRPRKWNPKHTAKFRRNWQATKKFEVQARQSHRRRAFSDSKHRVPPRCTARTILRTFCHLNQGANVLGDEQQDQEDTGARAVHCGHQLEKDIPSGCSRAGQGSRWYCTDTAHVNVFARPASDLAGDGFQRKQNTTCPKRKATMKPNKRQFLGADIQKLRRPCESDDVSQMSETTCQNFCLT